MLPLLLEQQVSSTTQTECQRFAGMSVSASDFVTIKNLKQPQPFSAQSVVASYDFIVQAIGGDSFTKSQSSEYHVEVETLMNFNYELKKPIDVVITRQLDGSLVGEIKELELYSFEDSEAAIMRDLNEDLTELFEDLLAIENSKLGKSPAKWKAILQKYIRKTDDD